MKSFFWERNKGNNINHLVWWSLFRFLWLAGVSNFVGERNSKTFRVERDSSEDNQLLFSDCQYSWKMWRKLFATFDLHWVFCNVFKENVARTIIFPSLRVNSHQLRINTVKLFCQRYVLREISVFFKTSHFESMLPLLVIPFQEFFWLFSSRYLS